ncbi:MAG: hypothetical protein ACKV2V_13250 [Blastocatellia bacterium]
MRTILLLFLALPQTLVARGQAAPPQQSQNPSPMVEYARPHIRLSELRPPGRREPLTIGTLFLPQKLKRGSTIPLLIHFHGFTWIPEQAAATRNTAVITAQLGSGSGVYTRVFTRAEQFAELIAEAEKLTGARFAPITISAWSAGYGAVREILRVPENQARVERLLLLDGLHTGYLAGAPGPRESALETDKLDVFLQFARAAMAGKKRMLITHTEIYPGTYASTTETADYLLRQLPMARKPVLRWGPMRTQQLSQAKQGRLLVQGYAGNTAPDHVDQIHALADFLRMLDKL